MKEKMILIIKKALWYIFNIALIPCALYTCGVLFYEPYKLGIFEQYFYLYIFWGCATGYLKEGAYKILFNKPHSR